ncbi:hypothetical protein [Nonomuraea typhae]|uniref:Fibronectin type III domain-containing protein n=1 Tax=Nonomuraea typhae TaxID=2603600 RepID=A0ABW7Z7H9_9ACTN
MTRLNYTVLTDQVPLEASQDGRTPSIGTLYLVVTNTRRNTPFPRIEVTVPVGDGAGDLTRSQDVAAIRTDGTLTRTRDGFGRLRTPPTTRAVSFARAGQSNVFVARPPARRFKSSDYMVLKLENVTVGAAAGLVMLTVRERLSNGGRPQSRFTVVPLVKAPAKEIPAPRNFRPDADLVEAGTAIGLSWEGSADFDYQIVFPGGPKSGPWVTPSGSPGRHVGRLAAAEAPRRDTTYTLIATSRTTPRQVHTLTTTVQVRNPILENLTVTRGIDTPQVQGTAPARGYLAFTAAGLEIRNESGGYGVVKADRADLNGINTEWVQGRGAGDGRITFPQDGLNVTRAGGQAAGTVFANYADLDIVKTRIVRGRKDDDGWISFRKEGLNIHQERGTKPGTLFANYADLDIVKTRIVRGREDDDGWISFRKEGLNIRRERGMERGTLFAAKTELSG